jgi:hypothetical protein
MYCTGRLWEINWVEHFHRVSAFNFSAKASDSVPSSCGGKVLLDLASSMRTFQNNSEHNFFQHLRTLSTRQKSDTLLKLHQNQQFFLILNSYSEKMLNVNFSVSRRFFKETLVIWTRITAAKEKMVQNNFSLQILISGKRLVFSHAASIFDISFFVLNLMLRH